MQLVGGEEEERRVRFGRQTQRGAGHTLREHDPTSPSRDRRGEKTREGFLGSSTPSFVWMGNGDAGKRRVSW